MTITIRDPLVGLTRGTVDEAIAYARTRGARHLPDVETYIRELWRLADIAHLDAGILFGQAADETGTFTSDTWERYRNPAGIGALETLDHPGAITYVGGTFSPATAARAHVVHAYVYAVGPIPAGHVLAPFVDLDPRYEAVIAAGYAGRAAALGYLSGRWAANPNYAAQIVAHANLAFPDAPSVGVEPEADPTRSPTHERTPTMTDKLNAHRYAIAAGHRNTTRGGATGEIDWTPGAARALAAGLRAVGAEVYLVSEHDGDADPDFTHQPLWAVGRVACAIAKRYGDLTAYLSMHYGGEPVRGFFSIPPDAGGLVPGGHTQAVHDDGFANNPLDVKLARAIAARVKATGTIPLRNSTEAGVMSERATGVGGSGWRLSELQETRPLQATTARLILEAGNILTPADAAYIRNPTWVRNVYVPAIVAGLRDVFGAFPKDGAKPNVPEKDVAPVTIVARSVPEWIEWSDDGNNQTLTAGGTTFYPLRRLWMTTKPTPIYQYGSRSSARLTDEAGKELVVPAKAAIQSAYIFRSTDGDWWLMSDTGGRVPLDVVDNPFGFLKEVAA